MKFSIVGPGYTPIPPVGWGAVESLIWDMRNVLMELGHEVDIVNTTDPKDIFCLLYTSPSPRDTALSRMPSSA